MIDGAGKEVEIAGSVEVKGIRGTDKRCYLVDLQGLTPRDMNYPDQERHHTCLLRPELLLLFQRTRNIEYATSKMSEIPKPSEEEKKDPMTDKEREEQAAKRAEDNLKRLREFERHLKDAPKYHFNTNVFKKGVTFAKSEADTIAKDEALVKELAGFLTEQAIPKLVRDLQGVEGVPTDSESLSQAFHQHGINIRYLGAVSHALADKELNHLKTLLERDAFVRSAKHLINEELRETSDTHLSAVVAHLLNLLVAPLPLIAKMDDGSISYPVRDVASNVPEKTEKSAEQQPETSSEQKKSKKNKKKEEKNAGVKPPADLGEMFLK